MKSGCGLKRIYRNQLLRYFSKAQSGVDTVGIRSLSREFHHMFKQMDHMIRYSVYVDIRFLLKARVICVLK